MHFEAQPAIVVATLFLRRRRRSTTRCKVWSQHAQRLSQEGSAVDINSASKNFL